MPTIYAVYHLTGGDPIGFFTSHHKASSWMHKHKRWTFVIRQYTLDNVSDITNDFYD